MFLLFTPITKAIAIFSIYNLAFNISNANGQTLSQDKAVETALKNNQSLKSAEFGIDYSRQLKRTATDIGKTSVVWMHGQYNSIYQDNNFTITQAIPFPTTLINQSKLGQEQLVGSQKNLVALQNEIAYQVKSTYEQLQYQDALRDLLRRQDTLYQDFSKASFVRFKTGESNLLEKTTAETQYLEIQNQLRMNDADIDISAVRLQALLKSENPIYNSDKIVKRSLSELTDSVLLEANPQLKFLQQEVIISNRLKRVERSKVLPDFSVGIFTQSLTGIQNIDGVDNFFPNSKFFNGFQLGLNIPLWISPHLARAKAAGFHEEVVRKNTDAFETTLKSSYVQAARELKKNEASLRYYENSALKNADLIISQSQKAYRGGEIGYIEYLQSLKIALSIKNNYLLSLTQYNQSVLKIEFLLGKI